MRFARALLEQHSIVTALAALQNSPLSRKRAMLLALLIDAEVDRRASGDLLAHRAAMAQAHPALGLVMALCAMHEHGPRLVLEAVNITAADAASLSEADYMVSLYNSATVSRVRIAWPDGRREDAITVLQAAVTSLERRAHPDVFLSPSPQRRILMDWNRVEGNWKQVKGKVKEQWGKLTDDDLDVIGGKRDQLEGKIQERYGKAKDDVRRDVDNWYDSQTWH